MKEVNLVMSVKVKIKHLKPGTVFNAGRSREGEQDEAEKSDI